MRTLFFVLCAMLLMGAQCGGGEPVCEPGETRPCSCSNGETGAQTCSVDGMVWEECECDTMDDDDNCLSRGQVVLGCGCHGPAYEGQVRTATKCCSNQAVSTSQGCYGYCAGGTVAWGNVCL